MPPDLAKNLVLSFLTLFLAVFSIFPAKALENITFDKAYLATIEQKYGLDAKRRLIGWQTLIQQASLQNISEHQKLSLVNNFFNIYQFIPDSIHWHKEDYWATPLEFIISKGGDCEDFAIIKYFTLRALNVSEQKILITYVKALGINQAHMVLSYYDTPDSMPLVLDNLISEIKPAAERSDLVPVYSFNGLGVWLASGKSLGKSTDMNRWSDMIRRMNDRSIAQFY